MKTLVTGLFPDHVLVASCALDPESATDCAFDEEALHVAKAIHQRQAEYSAGRRLAHGLLDELRASGAPLGPKAARSRLRIAGPIGLPVQQGASPIRSRIIMAFVLLRSLMCATSFDLVSM